MNLARRCTVVLLGLAALGRLPAPLSAQGAQSPGSAFHPRWEIPGLDFSPNGVWRGRAHQVRTNRSRLLAARQFNALNAAPVAGAVTSASIAVSGTIVEPVVLIKFKDTPLTAILGDTLKYDSVLYAVTPPGGRPYTVRTYYEQLSTIDGTAPLMTITGHSIGFVPLSQNEVAYTGTPGTCFGNPFGTANCNGLFSYAAYAAMQSGFREALQLIDNSVDWTQFSAHGDTLDLMVFLQPAKDGACGGASNNHIWAHRSQISPPYLTHSGLKVVDYIAQSGVGGASSCDTTQIMPVGTVAHETGHGFGLPDLYDTQRSSEGVGEYSLMGSGNYTSPFSPSRMDAWSLSQLGWVNVTPLPSSGTYTFGGVPVSDTTFYFRVKDPNPRGEYFLLENRQPLPSDTAMLRKHCQVSGLSPSCGGGLLIWHVDSTQVTDHGFSRDNTVNSGPIHGLALQQADGLRNLDLGTNRGDAGDPYPGATGNTAFSYKTNPAALKNSDGSFAGFAIDSIRQLTTSGRMTMSFRLRFGGLTLVRGTDTTTFVTVDAGSYHVYRNLLDYGSVHTISVADTQFTNANRTRSVFVSWSNGKPRIQTDTSGTTADTLIATLAQAHQLSFSATAHGQVGVAPLYASGTLLAAGTAVRLTATADNGYSFSGWTGDTSAASAALTLSMAHPYTVTANFGTGLVIVTPDTLPPATMGAQYSDTLRASGGTGSYSWQAAAQLPPSLALSTAGVLSGTAAQAGTFLVQARVNSASLQQTHTFTLVIAAPALSTQAVVAQLVNGTGTLTAAELNYLDLIGNHNALFDLGDFLAWVNATGAPATAPRSLITAAPRAVRKGTIR